MKTRIDEETLVDMFNRAGVHYSTQDCSASPEEGAVRRLVVEAASADDSPNRGYSGFVTVFGFGKDGSLIWIGAWE